ncbi:glycosyl transferase [Actinoplanes sp. NBRC 14428]|uniref:N-glycosyltransferase n=1 Tax=Pseudosporangium ferrugineum TaxID=439699 RepID=A0A2T0RX93_9ACTN|nr:glycosyltransferase [Pseudosporangium ferrugineum]PRY25791.1 N-glycosyltransferase [Pseudosporangium ferrugineum]BCJ56159.1 glycosyl transferase [Actinoplanes sp. NBRC 14428]
MRILFTCIPGRAHVNAMRPLVVAARQAGHQVHVVTAASSADLFAGLDVPVLAGGFDWSQSDPASLPEFHEAQGPPIKAFTVVAGRGMVDDLLRHAETVKPDLIVWDAMEFGGWIAAEVLGIPSASVASAMGTPRPIIAALTGPELSDLAVRYGLAPDPELRRMFGHLYVHRKPRILDLPYGERLTEEFRYRPAMFDRPPVPAPDWLAGLGDRPVVHLSLGTTFSDSAPARQVQRTVMEALAGEPVSVVISTGGADPASYRDVPDNVHLVPYVDHEALLPHCAAFLCHGSFSSVLVAIAHGVPMVYLPLSADQPVVSMHLANLGLGVNLANARQGPVPTLDPAALTAESVRAAVRTVSGDSIYLDRLDLIRGDFRRLPPVAAVVNRFENCR